VRRFSTNPARILGLEGGSLAVGAPADVTLIDPERVWTYDPGRGHSKSRNTPWVDARFTGRVVATFVAGRLAYDLNGGIHHESGVTNR
jgi:dihydroorotase